MAQTVKEWLDAGAGEKAASVLRLAPESVRTVIDVGAGTGSVLQALDRRGFAEEYWACEPSPALAAQMPRIGRMRETAVSNFSEAFVGRRFDLGILCHVLEHVRAPGALLGQVLDRADYVIVELPIEAGFVSRVRMRGKDRSVRHPAGHIHFFSEQDARKLVSVSGGRVLDERAYFPLDAYRARASGGLQDVVLSVAARRERLARLHYEHFAMLCSSRTFDSWTHHYPSP